MNSRQIADQCEQFICDITGGMRPKSKSLRYSTGRVARVNRSVVDVVSGNGTRLEVKWSGESRIYQWGWNVSNKLSAGEYDRMILVGADYPDYYRHIFDVPIRWILAWNKPTISCSHVLSKPSDYGYALHNWFLCTREQLADRYGPGKVSPAESWTPEQEQMLREYEQAEACAALNREFGPGASITDFIARKIQAGGNFDTVEQEMIQAMPQAAWDAIEAKVGSAALRALRVE
jgi:hypothetical protein